MEFVQFNGNPVYKKRGLLKKQLLTDNYLSFNMYIKCFLLDLKIYVMKGW